MLNHTSNAAFFSASVHHMILDFSIKLAGLRLLAPAKNLVYFSRLHAVIHTSDRTTNSWIQLVFWQTLVNVDECGDGWYAWGPRMVTVSIGPHRSLHTAHGVCLILSSVLLVVASSRKLWVEFWCVRESTSFTEQSIV
jgi:hypothetical protein